jgi:hypothetical protein
MGELSYSLSTDTNVNRRSGRQRLRLVLSMLTTAALAVSIITTVGAGTSHGAISQNDSIAVVNGQGRFTVLADLSEDTKTLQFTFGLPGDVPLMGDWNCNGVATPGAYRLSTGGVFLRNSLSGGSSHTQFLFGDPGDRAVSGDFDGDGCDTVAVYRSHRAMAYVKNTITSGAADISFMFGNPGDRSMTGDFNGNGTDTIGLHRNTSGKVYLGTRNGPATAKTVTFGNPGDQIVSGDWDGDGIHTIAAYRPSSGMFYYRNSNSTGPADGSLYVGQGVTVVTVSGVDTDSISGARFSPAAPSAKAPGPTPAPAPAPASAPVGNSGPAAGFDSPPARTESGPIDISGQSNVVIENVHVSNPGGTCINVTNSSNVTIRNSTIGPCGDNAVYLSDVDTANITGNYISGTSNGVLVHRSDSIAVDGNAFVNSGRNFVQFDKVNGAGSSISRNRGQNEIGGSNAEDMISLYQSNGTAGSPILIVGNHLRNGGPSSSGSGIMLGDGGGAHQIVEANVLVNPGQVGIGVASGSDVKIRGNQIFSSAQPWSNVGLYVWNQYGSTCDDIEVSGNQVNWTAAGGYSNAYWAGGGCSKLSVHDNNWDAPIGPAIF